MIGLGQEYFEIGNVEPISFEITNDERIIVLNTNYISESMMTLYQLSKFHLFGDNIFNATVGYQEAGSIIPGNFIENSSGSFVFAKNMTTSSGGWEDAIKSFYLNVLDSDGEESEIVSSVFVEDCDTGWNSVLYSDELNCNGNAQSIGLHQSQENIYNILYSGNIEGVSDIYNLIIYNQITDEFEYATIPIVSDKFSAYENGDLIVVNDEKILKVDNNLNTIFFEDVPVDIPDEHGVISTSDGGALIFGNEYSDITLSEDFKICKINSNGELNWESEFGGYNEDLPYNAIETPNGGFIIIGSKESDMSSENSLGGMWIVELNSSGDTISSQVYGNDGDYAKDIKLHPNGNYYILGRLGETSVVLTYSSSSTSSIYDHQNYNIDRKLDKTIDMLGKETKPQPNTPIIEIYDDGSVEKKIIIE